MGWQLAERGVCACRDDHRDDEQPWRQPPPAAANDGLEHTRRHTRPVVPHAPKVAPGPAPVTSSTGVGERFSRLVAVITMLRQGTAAVGRAPGGLTVARVARPAACSGRALSKGVRCMVR
jgi:hypothetical protein